MLLGSLSAILTAIALGCLKASEFIVSLLAFWVSLFWISDERMSVKMEKNPVSLLQEVSAAKFKRVPIYQFHEVSVQEFKCVVELCEFTTDSTARGKKKAKALAAEAMLRLLGIMTEAESSPVNQQINKSNHMLDGLSSSNENLKTCNHCCKCNLNSIKDDSLNKASEEIPVQQLTVSSSEYSISVSNSNISYPGNSHSRNSVGSSNSNSIKESSPKLKTIDADFLKTLIKNRKSNAMDVAESKKITPVKAHSTNSKPPSDKHRSFDEMNFLNDRDMSSETMSLCHLDKCNPVSFLQETLHRSSNIVPEYELINVVELVVNESTYIYEVIAGENSAIGSGSTKKEAKANAALSLMDILKIKYVESKTEEEAPSDLKDVNLVGQLITFCQTNNVRSDPKYTVEKVEGDAHCQVFSMSCTVGDITVNCSAKTKQNAKNLCAKTMLKKLEENIDNIKMKELTFESQLEDDDINRRVWQRLEETGARAQPSANVTLSKLPIKNYIHLFEEGFYGLSKTLIKLKSMEQCQIYSLTKPEELFRTILEELSIMYELSPMECRNGTMLNLYLKCNPHWSFIEVGNSVEEVKRKIFICALEFLYLM